MKFVNFASSSSGNCYWIELDRLHGEPVRLLIEAGIPYKDIVKKAVRNHLDLTDLDAVLITHSHSDHAKAVKEMAKHGFKVYGNELCCGDVRYLMQDDVTKVVARDTYVVPFLVEHDAPNPLGYVIQTDVEKILFVADNKFWKADLTKIQFDYIIIEANYDGRVLHFALKEAEENNDFANKKRYTRILNSHMSIANCIKMLNRLDLSHCKAIFLIHLSDTNSHENQFKIAVKKATDVPCYVCKKNGGML